jgi:hypothetical protein
MRDTCLAVFDSDGEDQTLAIRSHVLSMTLSSLKPTITADFLFLSEPFA